MNSWINQYGQTTRGVDQAMTDSRTNKIYKESLDIIEKYIKKEKESNKMTNYSAMYCNSRAFKIKNVIFNDPATIVFWEDGTKTVVKCGENDWYDPEKGLALCFTKKILGNIGHYYEEIKKWLYKYKPFEISEEDTKALIDAINAAPLANIMNKEMLESALNNHESEDEINE